ncbi:hypothetical protein GUITHDRAFT_116491 [Guillardia theta CCMP2712]|uniref:Coiled-coil domain-containing protein 112 n=1 Tax=Guillardia theta (strain CCMP2712) TaxID=905079 RepID=L1IM78_GUITC|nr:hypothetical protein GUITHDRAFT_116491 [Guillardia theta CCMP2712]EKX37378.1 hypothetical protein GUITHDRAFT_116491 [Guillardia theta CCMP2712]|eukprot:XP_005824358.1 hypothetical protein GUITHDRAFT_116491 [Guillardia theta CCMP2712]
MDLIIMNAQKIDTPRGGVRRRKRNEQMNRAISTPSAAHRSRHTAEEDKVAAWTAHAHQLWTRSKAAHKHRDASLNNMRGELGKEVTEAEEHQRKLASQRKEEAALLMGQLSQVRQNVDSLRSMIQARGRGPEYIERLRGTMDSIENEIYLVRNQEQEHLEFLTSEEKTLNAELAALERSIQEWATSDGDNRVRPSTAGASLSSKQEAMPVQSKIGRMLSQPLLPPEVVAVDRILKEEGGSTGGWDDADHERFLRYRTQFKGQPHIYCAKTADDLPDHDLASVERHELWYTRYLTLLEKKREAIRSWRTNRQHEQEEQRTNTTVTKEEAPSRRPQSAKSSSRDADVSREEVKEKLQKWKESKENERLQKQEEEAKAERERAEREKLRKEKERLEKVMRVENYKKSKKAEEEAKKREEEFQQEQNKSKISAEQLERIRVRNKKQTEEHINLIRRKEEQERIKTQRMEALLEHVDAPKIDRDPNRLVAPTTASMAKSELESPDEKNTRGYYSIMRPNTVMHVAARATPTWRSGM